MGGTFAETRFVVVDVETTGLRPGVDRVIEVAVYTADGGGRVHDRWSTLVQPDDRPLVGRLANLRDAPTFAEIAGELCARLAQGIVAGHNVTFDLRLIDSELERLGVGLPALTYFDTHSVATVLDVDTPNRSLAVLCQAMGVEFMRWHTADGDVEATTALIAALLQRAANWGRVSVEPLCGSWWATGTTWPPLPVGGRTLRRDIEQFPPGGPQPHRPSIFKPSWRRFGTGEQSAHSDDDDAMVMKFTVDDDMIRSATIQAVMEALSELGPTRNWPPSWEPEWIEAAEYILDDGEDAAEVAYSLGVTVMNRADEERSASPVGPALNDYYAGGFVGLSGIERLEKITSTLEAEGGEDFTLVQACMTLADLYRRHGGRHDDMVRTFVRGIAALERRCRDEAPTLNEDGPSPGEWSDLAATQCSELLQAWWDETMRQRDVDQLVELVAEIERRQLRFDSVGVPSLVARSLTSTSYSGELAVAEELYTRFVPTVARLDKIGQIPRAVEGFVAALAKAGRADDALRVCDQAWASGYADGCIAARHSLILERSMADFEGAARICRLALGPPPMRGVDSSISKRLERCEKKLGKDV